MRIYIPLTAENLANDVITPGIAHALTPELRDHFPREGEEELEYVAFLAAADDSLRAPSRISSRVVVAVDVTRVSRPRGDMLPTAVNFAEPIVWTKVQSIHVDEPEAAEIIDAARAGNDRAFEMSGDLDLLWYHPSERPDLLAQFGL